MPTNITPITAIVAEVDRLQSAHLGLSESDVFEAVAQNLAVPVEAVRAAFQGEAA